MSPILLGLITTFAPLLCALVLILVPALRRSGKPAAWLSLLGAFTSLGGALGLLRWVWTSPEPLVRATVTWLPAAGASVANIGLQLDGISISMLVVVATVALCVQVFSLGYMADEPAHDFGRYYAWQSLFLFSMLALVVAPNLLQLFAAWELVGLCSYLLIGFYWTKPAAARAAVKAFWVTKFADTGLLLGLILQFVHTGSFGWGPEVVQGLVGGGAISAVAALYFFAVMGKSAQFPLHIWLPDAMEGPTPVSALLHAATMVAAGVYLMVRAYPIFLAAEAVMPFISLIGGVTALLAACIAIVQTDIKKVLAYSTCSQLGYMVAALGSGSLMGGYFHLTTHAFFKALLFLAAGSVIHAVHSNEMAEMGGLWKKMKLTTTVFIIGALALAGAPMLSGFYSKDMILEGLHEALPHSPIYWVPYLACMLTVSLTAFYMTRVVLLTFFGAPSKRSAHAHESGPAMAAPLLLLALGSVSIGWLGGGFASLVGVHELHFSLLPFTSVGLQGSALAAAGFGAGFLMYGMGKGQAVALALRPVGDFIRSGPIDAAWVFGYQRVLLAVSAVFGWFDRYVIDGLINASGAATLLLAERIRGMQTGRVNDYITVLVVAVLVLAAFGQLVGGG